MPPALRLALVALLAWAAPAAQRKETLIYSRFDVDPGEWRYFEFPAKAGEARLDVRFEVLSPKNAPGVRVAVLREGEFRRFRDNQPHQQVRTTTYRREGSLRTRLEEPGGYVVLIDNRQGERRRCRVDLEVTLTTGPDPETLPVRYASPQKRLIVVAASLFGFGVITGWAGRALWRTSRRPETPRPLEWS